MSKIEEAFQAMPRSSFLPSDKQLLKNIDHPLPIGYGQTNSQPSTVRQMLEWLDPKSNQKILDIGSGSGWTTALLSFLVGSKGHVYAVEKVPELVKFGAENAKKTGVKNASFFEAGDQYGLMEYSPYDRILVSASAKELPSELLDQLMLGGRLVIPIRQTIHVIHKNSESSYEDQEFPGYVFVPLV